jgi:enoyl-CoA hydratase/carnithine racemase
MSDIVTERSGSILRVQLNRPAKKNAMTSGMYITLADLLNTTANDDSIRVVPDFLRTRQGRKVA